MNSDVTIEDRKKLAGLLGFAKEVLNARTKVQMTMGSGYGLFYEASLKGLPGLHLDCEDGAWLRIDRQRETRPPEPMEHIAMFMVNRPADPSKPPEMKPAVAMELTVEEATDLQEYGILRPENVHAIVEQGVEVENRVKVVLLAEDCEDTRHDFEHYVAGLWVDWAAMERPVRRAIGLYNELFKIHSAIHTSESTPPELVWGVGIGRWETKGQRIEMPLIEQLVEIEIESDGAVAIRPRTMQQSLSLKPYLEIEVDGAATLQRNLQEGLARVLQGENEFSPFTMAWEPLLSTAASQLCGTGRHVTRVEIDEGADLPRFGEDLVFASTWAIFGRPRSAEVRAQDLEALLQQVNDEEKQIPASIRGYASPPPDEAPRTGSDWGIDDARITGGGRNTWTSPAGSRETSVSALREPSATPRDGATEDPRGRRVHFFPLPFNEEQGKISDMIDDPKIDVVCVSGPPGTGKSHSIANIISHLMATGKRVLVTARTPEAIAAVREKLPKSLQPLVIASTGTDRESAQQLQDAVSELSKEVVGLDVEETLALKSQLETLIVECDGQAEEADRKLAEIARANLVPLNWQGREHAPMDLVDILRRDLSTHGWFSDRPADLPPAQLGDILERLRVTLPELAGDILYAGIDLPTPDELPATNTLIEAHQAELAQNTQEAVDYSAAPAMALDTTGAVEQARMILTELEACSEKINALNEHARALTVSALATQGAVTQVQIEAAAAFIAHQSNLDAVAEVRYELGACGFADFAAAAQRGAAGQKPVGFSLFGGALKAAVTSTTVQGAAPVDTEGWRAVSAACQISKTRLDIGAMMEPLEAAEAAPCLPDLPWDIASYLKDRQAEIKAALPLAARLRLCVNALARLFPYGLDVCDILKNLNCATAIFALRANIPDDHRTPDAIFVLRKIAGEGQLPVFGAMSDLAGALGRAETDPQQMIRLRGQITQELSRLNTVAPKLSQLGRDLDTLAECGAPDWSVRLKDTPLQAAELIPDDWQAAWAWAWMTGRVDRIVELGNGDDHRGHKADAMRRRRKNFEDLIRIRTLLGLSRRMTPRILSSMEAFTQAVSKIGTGKGKKAPRFIKAAQEAARDASTAAPVWIMPEYRIPEQLPAAFGDFDLVILDEASQSDVTALAALARGKKILVVGDEEQVSPTAVGIPMQKINALRAEFLDNLPNASLIDENASIFEITKRMYPSSHVMLREHFRCVAPIIQFSTRFYNNSLVPLRVPKASERFDPPLCDVHIQSAVRQGKTNASEAQWIVDEIARLVKDPIHARRDIGVISLIGGEQAEKIGRMLIEDQRVGPEVIKARRIIYGDARTMQGQERSIVLLSMVATPGKAVSQTSKADQQRINVAMSRAKDRLYLVRSVALGDLKPGDIKREVLQHFMDPMPEGRVQTGMESTDLIDRCQSGFEREVLKMLLEANYRVRPQVKAGGFSIDLVVEGDGDRRLAIELDGDAFHGPEVWERDMARQAALERAGWAFWRVFGSQWNAQKEFWWKNLRDTLTRMRIEPIGALALDERFTETITVDVFGSRAETAFDADLEAAEAPAALSSQEDASAGAVLGSYFPEQASPMLRQSRAAASAPAQEDLFSLASMSAGPSIAIGSMVRLEKLD